MILEENELKIAQLKEQIVNLDPQDKEYEELKQELKKLLVETYSSLSAYDRVNIARSEKRVKAKALINALIDDFYELHGDQYYGDDAAIIAGIGYLGKYPVTVLAEAKGTNTKENIKRNFGMTSPEGFRKTLRLARQAEKFNRPIITIVDTSGAYPGKGAEERGQARAIANNLMEFASLKVPVIAVVLSEGGSGGALALTVSDYIYMFENAIYSVLSPEGFASILFKNSVKVEDVCEIMKMTSKDLLELKIIDEIIKEPLGGVTYISKEYGNQIKEKLVEKLDELTALSKDELLNNRFNKYRNIG